MNDNRIFLYIIFGVIAFALWTAWHKDYPSTQPSSTTVTNEATTVTIAATTNRTKSASLMQQPAYTSPVPARRLVTINTDVLDLTIDTLGGNIVSAKLLKYPVSLEKHEVPMQIFSDEAENLYVATSALVSASGPDLSLYQQAHYTVAQQNFVLTPEQNELAVKLAWYGKNGLLVTKTFNFKRGHYDIGVKYNLQNQAGTTWSGKFIAQLMRKRLPEDKGGLFRFQTYTGPAISSSKKSYEKLSYDKLEKENLARNIQGGWLSFQQKYFLSAWIPDQNNNYFYFSQMLPGQTYSLGLQTDITLAPNQTSSIGGVLYVGPEIAADLAPLAKNLDLTIDYGWFWFISVGLFWLLQKIYKFIGNWGWSIIILTVIIKLIFYKLSEKSYRSIARMRDLTPQIQSLKEKYGHDRQKFGQMMMELYKKEKVNPLGGCLPNLIQIPFFIALYYVLIEAVQLRQAPFIFWIQDLSAKDPYYILPILMGLSMLLQNRFNPPATDPMQARMMMLLPVVFTIFFLTFPAGLVLYWLMNNCLSILQQWYIMRGKKPRRILAN